MRVSCEAIHVTSYMLKVTTIEKVDLELVTSLYHCGYPIIHVSETHLNETHYMQTHIVLPDGQ